MGGLTFPHGFINDEWQKLPFIFGISGITGELLQDVTLAAGTNIINGSVVPAGEVWIVTQLNLLYVGTVPTYLQWRIVNADASTVVIMSPSTIVSGKYNESSVFIPLIAGQKLAIYVFGATLNDDAYGSYYGYKMDVDL